MSSFLSTVNLLVRHCGTDKHALSIAHILAHRGGTGTGTQDIRDVVERLESGGRILSLIKKETKRVAKRKIIANALENSTNTPSMRYTNENHR